MPVKDVPEFQCRLRGQLAPWLTEEKYHQQGNAFSYAINQWYEDAYGPEALDRFLLWMRRIYLFQGPDRIAETVWKVVPYRSPDVAIEFSSLKWVFELLEKVKAVQEKKTTLLDDKLENETLTSSWDLSVLEIQYASVEGLENKIGLIGSYNIFLEAWEKHCSELSFEQLQSIFQIGKRVAEIREMQDWEVVFPASWRFELHQLLHQFAT